jgi:predicted peroxiredoxin
MAKNWKVGEAVRAIQAGNKEDILDIGRRFPLFANLAAQVNEAGVAMLDCVPDYCTARKIESVLKGDVQETENEEAAEEEVKEETPVKKAPAKKEAPKKAAKKEVEPEEEEDSLESKSAKELYDMCKEAGLKVKPKQDKSVYIDALNAANEKAEEEADWDEEEEEETPKKAPAKKAKKEAPAKKAAPKKEEDDDDDWEV